MQWLEVQIETNHTGLEPLEAFLTAQGIDSLVIDDETEFQNFLEQNHQYWDYVDDALLKEKQGRSRITFYLEDNDTGITQLAQLRVALADFRTAHPNCGSLHMSLNGLQDADWENNWKQYYHPTPVGEKLIVIPAWEPVPPDNRIPLILNPGLTFGTGSHITTQLCLTALEQCIHGGERVLDLGCGSGILSIAALRLGAASVFACDLDEKCQSVFHENAALNNIDPAQYTIQIGDVLTDKKLQSQIGGGYDLVLANIVADVIIALAPKVRPLLKPDGFFLTSGIIDTRAAEVEQALRTNGWRLQNCQSADGWAAYVCR